MGVAQAAPLQPGSGDAQHLRRLIDADRARGARRQDFEHAAGAGAKIEHGVQRRGTDRLEDRSLDALLGKMHGAHFVPIGRVRGEVARRLVRARLAHLGEPRAVGDEMRVGGREPCDDIAGEARRRAALADQKEHPGPLAVALDETGFGQQLQVTRDARLRLAENCDEFADRQFGLREQSEKAQPRGFAGGGQGGEDDVERRVLRVRHGSHL